MLLTDSVAKLKSVGESRLAALNLMGIETIGDLLEFFPRDYMDRSKISTVAELYEGQLATILVSPTGNPQYRQMSPKRSVTKIYFKDNTGQLAISWFNQPYMQGNFKAGESYYISGKVVWGSFGLSLENVEYERFVDGEELSAGRIVPRYRLSSGLTQKVFRSLIHQALAETKGQLQDFLPDIILDSQGLCQRSFAIENIHFPLSGEDFYEARKRLVFEELFLLQAALIAAKGFLRHKVDDSKIITNVDLQPVLSLLPFELTKDQNKVVSEIVSDLTSGYALNRLLQGDVGSGKTAIAMLMCYLAVVNGGQAVVMAPTETLAKQHFEGFTKLFNQLGITCGLLCGSQKAKEKREAKDGVARGAIQITIGTHALLQEDVEFKNLSLVITDEQHRFGVRQRATLGEKGQHPHILAMTATPIPRSLAMVLYGDMDISTIREMPPGRQIIDTYSVTRAYHPRIFEFIRKEIEKGHQAYIICPLIAKDEDEEAGVQARNDKKKELTQVMKFAQELASGVFSDITLGILHGKMKAGEKAAVMESFAKGETKILVSTTVVEVGINVPNATIIMIENAERFGISQLHQLRGRVGRSDKKSYCVLVTDSKNEVSKKRMEAMTKSNDGFVLSELDLEIRGPGEFFGTSQHGLPTLMLANLYKDTEVLAAAREAVLKMFEDDGGEIKHNPLKIKIKALLGKMQNISL
ncbi:MAG: ATP-dependent DNA helicase RecG [Defluviitaleaceae bacterium]|nr:ATP-dependent DNA helicase RecG [Defluviitaleaceae bacterium]